MATGQNTLMLADLPFVYSISNILLILFSNTIEPERFYITGLLAGLFGTFLVIIHPIQKFVDWFWAKNVERNAHSILDFGFSNEHNESKIIRINKINFSISTKTPAINFEKDKIAGTIYFAIILITIASVLHNPQFVNKIGLENFQYVPILSSILLAMGLVVSYLYGKEIAKYGNKLKLHALFFELLSTYSKNLDIGRLDMVKRSIDLNDWNSARMLVDQLVKDHWTFLKT